MNPNETSKFEDIKSQLYFYGAILIVPMGLILNLIQFIVFSVKDFDKANVGFMMRVWIVADSLALFWDYIIFLYLPSIGYDISLTSNISCFLFLYVTRVIQEIPFYFQIFFSFIYYLSVINYSLFINLNKKRNLIKCFILVVILLLFTNIPNMFNYLYIEQFSNLTTSNSLVCKPSKLLGFIADIETSFIRSLIPIILITGLNVLTVKAIVKPRILLDISIESEKKFAFTLIIRNLICLVFNFPLAALRIVNVFCVIFLNSVTDLSTLETIDFIYSCTRIFAMVYYSIGFFTNILFNKIFQKNFKKLKLISFFFK